MEFLARAEVEMHVFLLEVRELLAGRKTYLLASLLVGTVLALLALGRLTPETALTVALVFAGLISASFRSAIEQHHAEVLKLLVAIAEAGAEMRVGNKTAAMDTVKAELPAAEALVGVLKAEKVGGNGMISPEMSAAIEKDAAAMVARGKSAQEVKA
jgi:hypothetical protein